MTRHLHPGLPPHYHSAAFYGPAAEPWQRLEAASIAFDTEQGQVSLQSPADGQVHLARCGCVDLVTHAAGYGGRYLCDHHHGKLQRRQAELNGEVAP